MVNRAARRTAAALLASSCARGEQRPGDDDDEQAARVAALRSWLVADAAAADAVDAAGELADDDCTVFGRETLDCY